MEKKYNPIAVLDSGVGGISVLKELVKTLPEENFIFFGDEKNAPYGTKKKEEVKKIVFENADFLFNKKHAKALVIACNTATGAAVAPLREKYPEIPIIGIEPEIKTAALQKENPKVLVMATPLTLKQEKFLRLEGKYNDIADFTLLPCPGLMELIEEGHTGDETLSEYLKNLFSSLEKSDFDAIVLGCTHYPHAAKAIAEFFPETQIYDGCRGTAMQTARRLGEEKLLKTDGKKGEIEFITTSKNEKFEPLCKKLLGV